VRPHVERAIPPLRREIEHRDMRDGRVEVRDPRLLQVLMVDGEDFRVAQAFDGELGPLGLEKKLKQLANGAAARLGRLSRARIARIEEDFKELRLLDTPEVRKAEPERENVSPYTLLGGRRGLDVLPVAEAGATWTCHGCGHCCHGLAVELSKEEEARIDASRYRDILGDEPFYEDTFIEPDQPEKRVLRQREDRNGACIFLSPEGLCYVHARQGMEHKPNACQLFPYTVVHMPRQAPRLGVRVNCHSMYKSYVEGPELQEQAQHVLRVLSTHGAGTDTHKAPQKVEVFGKDVSLKAFLSELDLIQATLAELGLGREALARIDKQHLGGRVAKSRTRFGARMLAYLIHEKDGPVPIESGGYGDQLRRIPRGRRAFLAMAEDAPLPTLQPDVAAFFRRQIGHTLYVLGPLNAPDGGYGLVALVLGLEAAIHAVGRSRDLAMANLAFDVFTSPLLETMEHLWPIFEAVDPRYVKRLKKEMA
jgi:Fe-S-cluster containining protein